MAQFDNPLIDGAKKFLPQGLSGPIHSWIKEAVAEGEAVMQADPMWDRIDTHMNYIGGNQRAGNITQDRPPYVSHCIFNEVMRASRRHVSALTDIKPVYAYKTPNPNFQTQALLLNNLTTVWWINTFADLALADAAWYGAAAGCGDLVCEYDPFAGPQGDIILSPRDPRDTIPIRPSRDASIQSWFGVCLREAHSYNVLSAMYPDKVALLKQSASPWGAGVFTKLRMSFNKILGGGATTTLSGLAKVHTGNQRLTGNEVILYKVFLNDPSVNTTDRPITMGKPGASWSYVIQPGDRLYPRKRLIVATESGILFDGPSPYWHGMFPVARLKLIHLPWTYFGMPIVQPQIPVQDAINDTGNMLIDKMKQALRPPIVGNSRVSEPRLRAFDPLKPNARMRTDEQIGTGMQTMEIGDLPSYAFEWFNKLRDISHELTGDSTLDALQAAAANQSFDPESIEAFMNALSPEMKMEGRQVELCLREVANMMKGNIFQFYDAKRRMTILGDAGMTLQDFDYDPGNLIPAMQPQDEGYLKELDSNLDQKDRAQFFLKMFTFYVTPNSLLALNAKSEQMKYVQLARAGWCDFWTLMEKLEVPNVGNPPMMLLPMTNQPDQQGMLQIQAGMVPNASIDPMTGEALMLRAPVTITERLQAQAMLGMGMATGPAGASAGGGQPGAGRKASGQASPHIEEKPMPGGGRRITVAESSRDHK